MGDLVNLRRARKQRSRDDKERLAADNRVRYGRDKAEKTCAAAEKKRSETRLDGLRIDRTDRAEPTDKSGT
ncbi:DUF4169 family protein [Jiella pelagia]|uniref:DUF4169 family protein n=1 Tax=Jiella pelagia TaxID=2986949 RepID=A0ABY7BUF8_9HYPH|nr:DUF4169 family protein [Jiella pelagia]WAP67424.1 DUF4169 family protein [Jiella pelagia]